MPFFESTLYAAGPQFRGAVGAMVIDSDPIVKLVLFVLLIFSICSWGIIIQKWITLNRARKRGEEILKAFSGSGSQIVEQIKKTGDCPVGRLFNDAQSEMIRIAGKGSTLPASMLSNIEGKISNSAYRETMELSRGIGFLASISNASPFIGLFGTVWGIMDSFRQIGLMGSANLATVAPGISEALIATAAGLFVAIPAVLFYNYFSGVMEIISSQMERFQVEFLNWIRRGMLNAEKKQE